MKKIQYPQCPSAGDTAPIRRLVIWMAVGYHFLCAVSIWIDGNARKVTGLAAVNTLFGKHDAVAYMTVSAVAAAGLLWVGSNRGYIAAVSMLPQQIILLVSALGECLAIWKGEYPDGYQPVGGTVFILIDQAPPLLMAVGHTIAVFWEWFWTAAGTKKPP